MKKPAAPAPPRPVPSPTPVTRFFWAAAKKGKLALQYDPVARRYQFWPRSGSIRTGKRNLEWRLTSGRGTVYSHTVTRVPAQGFAGKAPYAIGLIELDEGVRIIANIVNVDPEAVKIGMRVKVTFAKISPDIDYFAFAPARKKRRPPARRKRTPRR